MPLACPSIEFLSGVSSGEAAGALEAAGTLSAGVLAALRGTGQAGVSEVVSAAATAAGPFVVGELAAKLEAEALFSALLCVPQAPLRMRRVLVRMRRLGHQVDSSILLDVLLRLETLLADAPAHGAVTRSLWLPRSLGVVVDSVVAVCECSGQVPVQASAATPVVVLADTLGVRSLFDLDGRDDPRAVGDRFDVVLLRQVVHGLLLARADGAAARLLYLLISADPDPAGVEHRILRRLLLSGRALVPPAALPRLWQTTLDA